MRTITKDITLPVSGEEKTFRLQKPDAFTGVEFMRLLLRLQEKRPEEKLTVLDLVTSLSGEELRQVMTSCLNHVSVLLPAGPNPVMTGPEWGWPEVERDAGVCLNLTLEEIAWSLEGFFGGGGPDSTPAHAHTSP